MARPVFLFAPGAGAPSSHPWIQGWKNRLTTLGSVTTFDYPYMQENRRRPDPLPKLVAAHRRALAEIKQAGDRIILIGKSMGGRIGCHVALEDEVDAVVCLGYPLCAAGDRTKLRDQVLLALKTPTLFVQGTRDSLCPLDLLETVRAGMKTQTYLHVVEGGDHSLMASKRQLELAGETQEQVNHRVLQAIIGFVNQSIGR